jgi:hypothetical protein
MTAELYKPYVWMQSISGTVNYLHFIVRLPDGQTIPALPNSAVPDYTSGTMTLTFNAYNDSLFLAEHDVEVEYELLEPCFENVVIIINDTGLKKKGQGSSQQSEGDTSGGG